MFALLLSLLTLLSATDSIVEAETVLTLRLSAASQLLLKPDTAEQGLAQLTEIIDDARIQQLQFQSPRIRILRQQAVLSRAQLLLVRNQPEQVVSDMTALLELNRHALATRVAALVGFSVSARNPLATMAAVPHPEILSRLEWLQPLMVRRQAHIRLQQMAQSQADQQLYQDILREWMLAQSPSVPSAVRDRYVGPSGFAFIETVMEWGEHPVLLFGCVFVIVFAIYVNTGRRQRRDGKGSWARLFFVACILALVVVVPMIYAYWLASQFEAITSRSRLVGLAGAGLLWLFFLCRNFLIAVTWEGSQEAPPLLSDETLLARIRELADHFRIAPPVTVVVHSSTTHQVAQGLITGIVAPMMVLYDGLLNRLSEQERDVILAHELAHVVNGTFWFFLGVLFVSVMAFLSIAPFVHPITALLLWFVFYQGLHNIVSRRLELDCDRRAAQALGYRTASQALDKIHAAQENAQGWMMFLAGAMGTHPSREERLATVHRAAPETDKPEKTWDAKKLQKSRLMAWVVAGVWLLLLGGGIYWSSRNAETFIPPVTLGAFIILLLVVLWILSPSQPETKFQKQPRVWLSWIRWIAVIVWVVILVTQSRGFFHEIISPMQSLGLITFFGVLCLVLMIPFERFSGVVSLEKKLGVLISSGKYAEALELCQANAPTVKRSIILRHNQAIMKAVLGQIEEAITELEAIRKEQPEFNLSMVVLVGLYPEMKRYEDALSLAKQISKELPKEPNGPVSEAWLLRKLGRLAEAEAKAQECLQKFPEAANSWFTLAGVALDRGDWDKAKECIDRGERDLPGTIMTALLEAELAVAMKAEDAPAKVEKLQLAARNNPFAFAVNEAAQLARRLQEPSQSSVEEQLSVSLNTKSRDSGFGEAAVSQ